MSTKSWAVIDDREHYKTLKYMYVAPIHIPMYLFGRGVAKFIVGSISVLIMIVFGMLFIHLRIELAAVNWPLFFLALMIGKIMLAMMALILEVGRCSSPITCGSWAKRPPECFIYSAGQSPPWRYYRRPFAGSGM